jgi:hypothetical protein
MPPLEIPLSDAGRASRDAAFAREDAARLAAPNPSQREQDAYETSRLQAALAERGRRRDDEADRAEEGIAANRRREEARRRAETARADAPHLRNVQRYLNAPRNEAPLFTDARSRAQDLMLGGRTPAGQAALSMETERRQRAAEAQDNATDEAQRRASLRFRLSQLLGLR